MSNATRTRKATVSNIVFISTMVDANGSMTPAQLAERLGMKVESFNQRLNATRKSFREDAGLREEFADQLVAADGSALEYPKWLDPADGRRTENGGGTHREKGVSIRAALRAALKRDVEAAKVEDSEATPAVEVIDEI